jgi:hypothetical protein
MVGKAGVATRPVSIFQRVSGETPGSEHDVEHRALAPGGTQQGTEALSALDLFERERHLTMEGRPLETAPAPPDRNAVSGGHAGRRVHPGV